MHILVTGANGQLGKCLKDVFEQTSYNVHYCSREELDITNSIKVNKLLSETAYDYVINCAAYTDVAGAETNEELALKGNAYGPKVLAECCAAHNVTLIHISTDYVFDGSSDVKYEDSPTNPINRYGRTKRLGEEEIINVPGLKYRIIRTSWLYSEYGKNFVKTIMNKIIKGEEMKVVCDQVGSPTYAKDLALFIVHSLSQDCHLISEAPESAFGIFNYSNLGTVSWYDFATAIEEYTIDAYKSYNISCRCPDIVPCFSNDFPSIVKRPAVGILSKSKVINVYGKKFVPYWKDSLKTVINTIVKENVETIHEI